MVDRLSLDSLQLGVALACTAVGALVAMPVTGALLPKHGARRATQVAVLLVASSIAAVGFAPTLPLLCLGTMALGAGNGGLDIATNAYGLALERRYRRPILSGFHAAFSVGGLLGSLMGALAIALGSGPGLHLSAVGALFAGVGLIAVHWFTPLSVKTSSNDARGGFARPTQRLLVLGGLAFCCMLIEGAAGDWSGVYLRAGLGTSATVAALGFAAFSLAMLVGRAIGDRLVERVGPVCVVAVGASVAAAGFGAALLIAMPGATLLGYVLLGLGTAGIIPILFRAAGALPGMADGAALSTVTSLGYVGFLAGPAIIGPLAAATSLRSALFLTVILAATVAAFAPVVRPPKTIDETLLVGHSLRARKDSNP
jgi:MFS family permease